MTEPIDWIPSDMEAALRERLAEGQDNERRRVALAGKVADMPGALGDLLRTITVMYADWVDASEMRAVTEAESIRMEQIVDAAVRCEAWLGSSATDGTITEICLGDLIAEIADQTGPEHLLGGGEVA